jgi:hypothetical protein
MPGASAPKASAIQAKRLLKPTSIRAIRGSQIWRKFFIFFETLPVFSFVRERTEEKLP